MASAGMGDCLWASNPPQYVTEIRKPTQPPTLHETANDYQPKCGDALQLGSTGTMAHSICGQTCGWQVNLCGPSLARANPSALDEYCRHYKCPVYLLTYFTHADRSEPNQQDKLNGYYSQLSPKDTHHRFPSEPGLAGCRDG